MKLNITKYALMALAAASLTSCNGWLGEETPQCG